MESTIKAIQDDLSEIFKILKSEKLMKKLLELINTLKILQSQLEMLQDIFQSPGDEDQKKIKEKYSSLAEFAIEISKKDQINCFILDQAKTYIKKGIFDDLNKILANMKKKLNEKNLLNYINDFKIIVIFLKKN